MRAAARLAAGLAAACARMAAVQKNIPPTDESKSQHSKGEQINLTLSVRFVQDAVFM